MDQMTSACGEANKLLAMVCQVCTICAFQKRFPFPPLKFEPDKEVEQKLENYFGFVLVQPAEVLGLVEIPTHIRFWGIDSGIRHRYQFTKILGFLEVQISHALKFINFICHSEIYKIPTGTHFSLCNKF